MHHFGSCFTLSVLITPDQPQLLLPRQLLHRQLPLQGIRAGAAFFPVDHREGTTAAGVFGPFSALVDGQAAVYVIGDAGVESAVAAAEDVKPVVHFDASFLTM